MLFQTPLFTCASNSLCELTGRMLRHGNGPGRQAWSHPQPSILPGVRHPSRRVKGPPSGVRTTRVVTLAGWLVPVVHLRVLRLVRRALCSSICLGRRVGPQGSRGACTVAVLLLPFGGGGIGVKAGGKLPPPPFETQKV